MPARKLTIYNTLSGKKEVFRPLKAKKVSLFVCGPTVYEFSHLGHARTYIVFDCFAKYLQRLGYQVFYLQNVTNVDDKIIARAREKGVPPQDLAIAFEKEYLKDMKMLDVDSVKKYARATDHIKEIISQISRLIKKGYAYPLDDGVYFNITRFKGYGKLSGRTNLQAEDSVSRVDYNRYKKNRGDFCLWKLNEGMEGEPSWPSPFGAGRPGWHIEDTAITEKFFGARYDIHGGGRDLLFPHHEAEVTQMEALSGKSPMARYWMHTGFLMIDGQKMSKSLNNFILINTLLRRYSAQQLRYLVVKSLWRSPINFSESVMIEVTASLERIEEFLRKIKGQRGKHASPAVAKLLKHAEKGFYASLNDDFNTPQAFAALFDFIRKANSELDKAPATKKEAESILDFFMEVNEIFGIIDVKKLANSSIPAEVTLLASQREAARAAAEWQKADDLRKEIATYGYVVEDTKSGPVLKKI